MKFDGRRYRPMGLLDLFDEAFDLYKSNFALFLSITALVYVPVVGVGTYISAPLIRPLMHQGVGAWMGLGVMMRADVGWLAFTLGVNALLCAFLITALVYAASARYKDEPVTLVSAYRAALRSTAQVTVIFAVYAACVIVGLATVVVPGLVILTLTIPLQLFVHAIVNEGVRGLFAPLNRAWKLASGYGSFILGGHIVHWFLWSALISAAVGGIEVLATYAVDSALPLLPLLALHKEVAETIALELSCMILLPFQICVVTMFYFDLRIRKDGYDIDLLARSLGYPSAAGPPEEASAL